MDVERAAAVVDGHVAAFATVFAVGEELIHELGEGEAALLEYACLAVLGEDDVRGMKSRGRSDCYAFLTSRDLLFVRDLRGGISLLYCIPCRKTGDLVFGRQT